MKKTLAAVLIGVGINLSLFGVIDQAQALDGDVPKDQTATPAAVGLALYKPPMLGAPRLRIGGGVRGTDILDAPVLHVLAPLQTGQTTMEQPVLYWHLDKPTKHEIEITVMAMGGVSPLIREVLAGPVAAGLHAFRLASQDQRLALGKEYEWFVAVILDPSQRSKDIIASGGLSLVAVPPGLQAQLSTARSVEHGLLYAGAGLWYDAINALVEGMDKAPDKTVLSGQFAAILKQEEIAGVGLTTSVRKME